MTDEEIRVLLLSKSTRERIKDLMITTGDEEILRIARKHSTCSSEISNEFGISIQSASLRLKRLSLKGYLRRVEIAQESGGYEWMYFNNVNSKEKA